ncbi:hypothetical protein ACH9L7_19855 (plasmid) [Haloferax sp. S1W]|uniref:hypothetical protein n=1 Tax=Haloferax sp. S1W TaxID=3377110 RepID=UPI0037C57DEB
MEPNTAAATRNFRRLVFSIPTIVLGNQVAKRLTPDDISHPELYYRAVFIERYNLAMSGDSTDSHPARKIDRGELKGELGELNEDVPALTRRVLATEFPEVEPQTVGNNLDDLAEGGEICRFNDGNTKLYWYPRERDEGGTVKYSELIDDSIDWGEIDVTTVPKEVAQEIAAERLPYYQPRSFWTQTTYASQLGVMIAFGMVILGIGGLVGGTLGLGQNTAARIFQAGLWLSLFAMIGFVISLALDNLAAQDRVPVDPLSRFRR